MIYIFKGANGDMVSQNEVGAYNEIYNKGNMQRQDLVYLGACDDRPLVAECKQHKNRAIETVIAQLPKVKLLEQEIQLATMDKDEAVLTRKKLELDIYKGNIDAKVRDRTGNKISAEIDEIMIAVQKEEKRLYDEAFANLVPNPSIKPRDFTAVTSNFGGDNAMVTPINFITPKD